MLTNATLCCDPLSWFERGQLVLNPSVFVLGLPGLGKSTIVRRMALGLAGFGTMPVVLGDLKPDHVDLVQALGGQVIPLGRGRGSLNVLDPGEATAAAARLTGNLRDQVLAEAHGRRHTMVCALLQIIRSQAPTDREETILDQALKVLDDRHVGVPVLADLLEVIRDAPDSVRQVALDRGNLGRYRDLTEHLEASLSRECDGSAGPLVAALTVAVVEAAETRATRSPGGRLPFPLVAVLDEAANICRFRNLDSYYSHFGSRGIVILTILQNWAQGEEVWGKAGMEKLWSAANIKLYGGGVDDDRFLRRLSDLIGSYDRVMTSETQSRGQGRQRSRSVHERTILTIAELRELPRGRAILFATGTPAAMIEPQPWYDNPGTTTRPPPRPSRPPSTPTPPLASTRLPSTGRARARGARHDRYRRRPRRLRPTSGRRGRRAQRRRGSSRDALCRRL